MIRKLSLVVVALTLLVILVGCGRPPLGRYPSGKPIYDWTEISDASILVVWKWKSSCSWCKKELSSVNRLAETLRAQRVAIEIVGLNVEDDPQVIKEIWRSRGVSFRTFYAGAPSPTPTTEFYVLEGGEYVLYKTVVGYQGFDGLIRSLNEVMWEASRGALPLYR